MRGERHSLGWEGKIFILLLLYVLLSCLRSHGNHSPRDSAVASALPSRRLILRRCACASASQCAVWAGLRQLKRASWPYANASFEGQCSPKSFCTPYAGVQNIYRALCACKVTSRQREMGESPRNDDRVLFYVEFNFARRQNPANVSEEVVHIDLFIMFPYFHVKIISSLLSSF